MMRESVKSERGWLRGLLPRLGGRLFQTSRKNSSTPIDDLFSGHSDDMSVAGIPATLRRQLQEESIRRAFHRLKMPLRFLMYATSPGREPQSLAECREILALWRQGLEQEIMLTPDGCAGAVRNYDPAMEREYTIAGSCRPGEPLRIVIPCWRLHGEVIVRGEAEPSSP